MPRRIYVGPIHAVDTVLDGVEMRVERGQAVDVSEEQAALLDRDTVNWMKPKASSGKKDGDS